ncbi:hypothetical protein QYE76_007415 [Lolium multiflorum]|uniref:UBX domain-containing protein n=1 Tax=Lolium multiflorum TaxID=4521 RepID=A0AAD8RXK2_LOLMU|nr:hypothetical protein QYE76_007415 [Lolium multiflorum]
MDQEDDHDDLVVEFMQVTACSSLADAARHLASCGWRLAEAVNLYFAAVAGSSSSAEHKPLRAPIPARSDTLYGATSSSAASRQPPAARPTGWESDSEHGNLVAADHRRRRRRRRRHRDERASADNNTDDAVEPTAKKKKTLAELFSPPLDLAYKGGFHDAKSHAAEMSRWLLVNVQATAEFASHQQNRDVWANDLVAQAVRDHFVLWQVDVHDRRGNDDEGGKVCCYYKLAHDKMPIVLVVDPVTGQMMRKLRAATDPNGILVMAETFAERKPIMPIRSANNNVLAVSSAAPSSSPSGSSSGEKKEPAITARKQCEAVAAAVAAPIGEERTPSAEKTCKLRVRFPDGQVVTKEFAAKCSVAALFAFCRSSLANGEEQPFRLMRFAGGSMQEISHDNVSFEDLGLHMSTVSMALC